MRFFPAEDNEWKEGNGYSKCVLLRGKKELLVEGAIVQLLTIAPETTVPPHYHEQGMEVFHIISGKGIMTINDETFHMKKGDTLTCDAKEVHSAENPYDEPFEYIIFKTNWNEEDTVWI